MGRTGLEHLAKTTGKTSDSKAGGAESGAVADELAPIDPDVRRIIEAWPTLPKHLRQSILALVQAGETSR